MTILKFVIIYILYTTNYEKNTQSDMDGFLSNLVFLNNNNNNLLFQTMVHMEKKCICIIKYRLKV